MPLHARIESERIVFPGRLISEGAAEHSGRGPNGGGSNVRTMKSQKLVLSPVLVRAVKFSVGLSQSARQARKSGKAQAGRGGKVAGVGKRA